MNVSNIANIKEPGAGSFEFTEATYADMDAGDTATVTVATSNGTKIDDIGPGTFFSGQLIL